MSIPSDCSTDVTHALRVWFKSLPAAQTVVVRPGACYLVNRGIKLLDPQGLTVYGGTFRTAATLSGPIAGKKGLAMFTMIGGSHVTLEEMQIVGANPGGYHPALAFAAGIDFEGTADSTIRSVTIRDTFGDGITLSPLRGGSNHNSGSILAPASDITIRDVTIDGVGRQGLTLASVSGAQISDVILDNPGFNTFDVEADQGNEGASNVTIDGCEASGGKIFFANGGSGYARETHDITVEHCTMDKPEGGVAVYVKRPQNGGHKNGGHKRRRGPFTFVSDKLWCGVSVYVPCVQLSGADVTVTNSTLRFPAATVHEAVYGLVARSQVRFTNDIVKGYGRTGDTSRNSSLVVNGGRWVPTGGSVNNE